MVRRMIRRQKSFEAACLEDFTPPISIDYPSQEPSRISSSVIFASPHSGQVYPDAFVSRSSLSLETLRRNEDAFIDVLLGAAPRFGAPLLTARFPRCFVDVNRSADELPASWVAGSSTSTPRADIGLGVIPTIISEKCPIYTRPLKPSCVKARLNHLYYPYHRALRDLITMAKDSFGHALVIDCHSMPGFSAGGSRRTDIILGDRYGTSCAPETVTQIERLFTKNGYSVTRNYPYAGGYVTSHYGQPHENVEVLQVEINRDLYLNPVTLKPKRGYDRLARDLTDIIEGIIATRAGDMLLAAE